MKLRIGVGEIALVEQSGEKRDRCKWKGQFKGKVAFMTGAASGMGRGAAET
jgi:hypothetical protein